MSDDFVTVEQLLPWSAGAFQVQRYGTRYYTDPLPACPLGEPTSDTWPGFSSIKPHRPFRKSIEVDGQKMVVPLDLWTARQFLTEHPQHTDADFYGCVGVAQQRAFARGHAIHATVEAQLLGQPTPVWAEANVDAAAYLPHVRAWVDVHVADVIAIEAVVLNRSLGYGGTGDAWLRLKSGVGAYVDWKSRGVESGHGIYDEEICQGGAYTGAEYMIGPTVDRAAARRLPLPDVTHGVVVSIRPDGTETFFYELVEARAAFGHMLAGYRSVSSTGKAARRAKLVEAPQNVGTALRRSLLRERCKTVAELSGQSAAAMAASWPAVGKLTDDSLTDADLDVIEAHIQTFETAVSAPFPQPQPSVETPRASATVVDVLLELPDITPDEGPEVAVDDPTFTTMQSRYASLDGEAMAWMARVVGESMRAGRSLHMQALRSTRRVHIVRGLVELAAAEMWAATRGIVAEITGCEAAGYETHPLGAVVSLLNADQAVGFASFVADMVGAPELATSGRQ